MDEIFKLLVNADTAMVAVTFALCQIIKRFLPSPAPDASGETKNWSVERRYAPIPFAAAFVIGICLSIIFDPHEGQTLMGKIRDGLQTGAYSVLSWELWSNVKKLFGGQ